MVKTIYMGEFDAVRSPNVLKTTLGSCVGVVLYDPQTDTFGMAHIMLPHSTPGETANPGKYADTALPALMALMGTPPSESGRLRAKLAGGANMFAAINQAGDDDVLRVGERNILATLEVVKQMGIKILGQDLGGVQGRELTIDAQSGKIWVRAIGSEPKEL